MDSNPATIVNGPGEYTFKQKDATDPYMVMKQTAGQHAGDLLGLLMYIFVFGFFALAVWLAVELSNDQ